MSNFGPAVPARIRRTVNCGIQAYLEILVRDLEIKVSDLPFIVMKYLDAECGDNPCDNCSNHNADCD